MRVGHISDIHGCFGKVVDTTEIPDLWVATGDMLPNESRGHVETEIAYQTRYWATSGAEIAKRFGRTPVVCVNGNHDYISFAACLREHGVEAYEVTEAPFVEVLGLRFAGFREIPYIRGEWNGECHDFEPLVTKAMAADPDILLTHAPPAGILDKYHGGANGIQPLISALTYQSHRIKAHFFGHNHDMGGQDLEEMGIRFFNGATQCQFHTL